MTWWAAEDFDGLEVADVAPGDPVNPGDTVSWAPAGGVAALWVVVDVTGDGVAILRRPDDVDGLELQAADAAALDKLPGADPGVTEPEVHE